MNDTNPTLSMISASLWDLRVQCEQQLRCLGDAQVTVDAMRAHQEQDRTLLRTRLTSRLGQLQETAQTVTEVVKDCHELVQKLPH